MFDLSDMFDQPLYLLLLLLLPVLWMVSFRSLSGLGPIRRWFAMGLRSAVFLLIVCALAELQSLWRNIVGCSIGCWWQWSGFWRWGCWDFGRKSLRCSRACPHWHRFCLGCSNRSFGDANGLGSNRNHSWRKSHWC